MKVIYLGFNDPRIHARGVEYVIQSQAAAASRGYYVFLGARTETFRWGRLLCISVARTRHWPITLNRLLHRLRHRAPGALVHAHNYLMALAVVGRVDLFTVHDALAYLKRSMGSGSALWGQIESMVYRKSRRIHFISDYARSMAHPAYRHSQQVTVLNTCPRELLASATVDSVEPAPTLRPYALVVRSIEERAALDLVIEAARQLALPDSGVELDIVVAGKGPMLAHYQERAQTLAPGRVHMLGYVSDQRLAGLYRGARLTITPALYGEGFGLPVAESLFYGKEALASAVCALPEVVMHSDFLFENNVSSLVDKVKAVLAGQLHASAADCRSHYDQHFGLARYRQSFMAIYADLAQ